MDKNGTILSVPQVKFEDWGEIDYQVAWDKQTAIHNQMVTVKKEYRDDMDALKNAQNHTLVFCSHPHVYTLGKSGDPSHLKLDDTELVDAGATYYKINRGGDITYHGPGQIVGYLLFDLDCFKPDVHLFVRNIELSIISLLSDYGITGVQLEGYTGVWVKNEDGSAVKLCAIGVHLSRWISMHGFALNVNPNLGYFNHIVACGITDDNKSVASMEQLVGYSLDMREVKAKLLLHMEQVFGFTIK